MVLATGGSAGAGPRLGHDPSGRGHVERTTTCVGSIASPGVLAGTYHSNVVVNGVCSVNGGPATILGDLTLSPGSGLLAAYALNDFGQGSSSLTVTGNLVVHRGASALIGCEAGYSPCLDDPTGQVDGGTLFGQVHILGSLLEIQPLGVIVHAVTIGGDVAQFGGGGGLGSCTPPAGSTFQAFNSPVYSDYEDNTVGGDLAVIGVRSCWFGGMRNTVHGSIAFSFNSMAQSDGNEVVQNTVLHNMTCIGNSPSVQYGDSGSSPNVVGGHAFGQCGFNALSPDPYYGSGGSQPVSVKAS